MKINELTKLEFPPWTVSLWLVHDTNYNLLQSRGHSLFHLYTQSIRTIAVCASSIMRMSLLNNWLWSSLLIMRLCFQDGSFSSSHLLIGVLDFLPGPELIGSICLASSCNSHLPGIWLESHWAFDSLWSWGLKFPEQPVWGQFFKVIS